MIELQTIQADLTKVKINGYELTNLLIRNGKRLNLKPAELLVFTALATYWNGKPVYPRITTLADNTAQSEKTVRTALNGLVQKGYLIKSKRSKNANIYNININAVLSAVNSTIESGKIYQSSAVNFTAPCIKSNHEKLKKKTTTHEKSEKIEPSRTVVAFYSNSKSKSVTPNDVPDIIKQNKKVLNPCAYWASLSDEVKKEYLDKQKKKCDTEKKIIELRKAQELKKQKEQTKQERLKNEPPFWEVCDRDKAVEHLKHFLSMPRLLHSGYRVDLMRKFSISLDELKA